MIHLIKFNGLYPPIVTSYSKEEYIVNIGRLGMLLRWLVKAGVDGVVVIGSSGEAPYLDRNERVEIIRGVKEVITDKKLIAGIGSASLRRALRYAEDAEEEGVDAFLVITPFYFRYTQEEIIDYYRTISKAVDTPILLYNFPQTTGIWIEPETVDMLVDGEKIVGMKDSSGDLRYHIKILSKIRDRGNVLCGNARIFPAALAMGADGLILALANLLPRSIKNIYEKIRAGYYKEAIDIYWKIYPLIEEAEKTGIRLLKFLLNKIEFDVGPPRPPMKELVEIDDEDVYMKLLEEEVNSIT